MSGSKSLAITVNDQPRSVPGACTLQALMTDLGLSERRGVAAAVNGSVVPRSAWGSTALAEADKILVIQATQGG